MKLEFRHIKRFALQSLLLILGTIGYAQASVSANDLLSDTTKTKTEKLAIVTTKSRAATKMNMLAEESDKIINNVKVFYNPISQQVSVNFKLSKDNNVIIKVMDALGNEVLALHNGNLDAGSQNLNFDTHQKLSEGFYFVRVSSGTETVVKRISVRL